jgi:hypothetical protein
MPKINYKELYEQARRENEELKLKLARIEQSMAMARAILAGKE